MSFPPVAVAFASLALAGIVVLVVAMRAHSSRGGRSILRSIPEGIARAKKAKRHVLVFFVDPLDELTGRIMDLAFAPDFARIMLAFERVRIDAGKDDLDVASHVAAKYGLASVEAPTLLVLDRDGRRIDSIAGKAAFGEKPEELRERFAGFLEKARARF